jgi:dTDP-4-amino-4,6-dideoxygalactose transaminase
MDPNCLEDALARPPAGKLKAIIPVHLYGHPADMDSIMEIAREHDLLVIEDCAHAHGAIYKGKNCGTFGHMAAFSFYPTKNLGAFGDGGALLTNDITLYDKAKALREYGWGKRYISYIPGMNTRLDELQAAILRVKLKYLNKDNKRRRDIAKIYNDNLKIVEIPIVGIDAEHVYHQYVIRVKEREIFQKYMSDHGIITAIHYPVPVHLQDAYVGRIITGELKVTEEIMSEIVSLPIYSQIELEDVAYICSKIEGFFKC